MDKNPNQPFPQYPYQPYQSAPQAYPQMTGMPMMQSVYPQYNVQQNQFMTYVQQQMQQRNIPQQYLQDPNFRNNFIQSLMPMMPRAPMYQMPPPQAPPPQPLPPQQPMMQKKKGYRNYDDYDSEEMLDDEPSSEEAEFTDESESSEDMNTDMNDDYVGDGTRRTSGRDRSGTSKDESDTDLDDEEEFYEGPQHVEESKIEHIYVSRIGKEDIEYLVRFQDSKDCLSQWEPESLLMCLENANYHLNRFRQNPVDITGDDKQDIVPIAYRKNDSVNELLYRFTFEQNVLLYWDAVDDETLKKFRDSRHRVDVAEPPVPQGQLPEPTASIINPKSGSELRNYQLEGLKWLIKCWQDGHGSILADEMGLGKTIQVLSFLQYLNEYTDWHGPFLITVRTNTFKQWCEEIEKWTNLAYIPYSSGPQQRRIIREYQFPFLDEDGNPIPNTFSFNILLVSFDVFLKDVEFLSEIQWECLIVDEGHRIKNRDGKKNNALKSLNTRHRIILTGTPVQNTLQELWTLLNFVSPDQFEENPTFVDGDIESLSKEALEDLRNRIKPHLLRRSLAKTENTIGPKEESLAFVSLTNVQRELIRLIKLHSMWRLKGVQVDESSVDTSHESVSILKACCHPFLIDGAEEYYTKRLNVPRIELLRNLSSKFIWLSKVLENLRKDSHKVLIFSQKVQLLHLLREFCILSGYNTELLIGDMSDTDKNEAIDRYSKNPDSFVFLISTRAGSEGLNLTVADTAIIFDPDWNPQNDLQAQARVHRIGQTQKVDIIRLITYQTYEHDMFIRAQKKLSLWLELLGEDETALVREEASADLMAVDAPPYLDGNTTVDDTKPLLDQISTVVRDFSLSSLPRLEKALSSEQIYSDSESDESFLSRFPVSNSDVISHRAVRSRSYDNFIDSEHAYILYEEIRKYGYGSWDTIASKYEGHSPAQIERFCCSLLILCFRALPPSQFVTFPCIVKCLSQDVRNFNIDVLLCTRKGKWIQAFPEDHELFIEINACKPLKDTIYDSASEYLTVIEMKLIAQSWLTFNDSTQFDFTRVGPTYRKNDSETLSSIISRESDIDPYDERVEGIVRVMREDIIRNSRYFIAQQFEYWTSPEFSAVVHMMSNFTFSFDDPLGIHVKTGLLSKTTEQVVVFVSRLSSLTQSIHKYPYTLPSSVTHFEQAPQELQNSKGSGAWMTIQRKEHVELVERMSALRTLKSRSERLEDFPETTTWSNYHTKILFRAIVDFGLDRMKTILLDKKIGLVRVLNKHDRRFVEGKLKNRIHEQGSPPDFVLSDASLLKFLQEEDCDQFFEKQKYKDYTYVPPEKHYEYNFEDSSEYSSDAALFVDDYVDVPNMRRIRREDDNYDNDVTFNQHLLESDD